MSQLFQPPSYTIESFSLKRPVRFDMYGLHLLESASAAFMAEGFDVLLINDGQDLIKMKFDQLLHDLHASKLDRSSTEGIQFFSRPLLVVGIHAGPDRKQEYGVSGHPDYMGRGARAHSYAAFVLKELMPFLSTLFNRKAPTTKYLAGFSLGGLMAFDMLMDHPDQFSAVGVFSGAFWWRSRALGQDYDDAVHRIMHAKLRLKTHVPNLRFFLQTGQLDETEDRNNNGIIDSIDDAIDIMVELEKLGYRRSHEVTYLELVDGRHNIETWAKVMPQFLRWLQKP